VFHPFTVPAKHTSLDQNQQLKCLCGKDVRLGDCLCVWTHAANEPDNYGYYAACSPQCVIIRVTEGHA
jgi:hypothetical protein